jgi:release factor glutamine methyltransferase
MIANAPYVPTDAIALMPPEARLHEPTVALDGGRDGLDVLRRVLALAPRWLVVGGHLLVEINDQQGPPLIDAALRAGMQPEVLHSDELGATALMARMPRT